MAWQETRGLLVARASRPCFRQKRDTGETPVLRTEVWQIRAVPLEFGALRRPRGSGDLDLEESNYGGAEHSIDAAGESAVPAGGGVFGEGAHQVAGGVRSVVSRIDRSARIILGAGGGGDALVQEVGQGAGLAGAECEVV